MRNVLNTLAWGSAAIALAMAVPGCNKGDKGSEGDEATGSIKAALAVGGERHDVTAVHYKVVGGSSTCSDAPLAETTSVLEDEQLPGSVLPAGAGVHAGADGLFVLPPGTYRVCATPMSASGPSQECASTEGTATVISSATTEIVLVSQCGAAANGGLDVVVALNDPPSINDLDICPSKFIIACQTATITAVAADPDGDAFAFAWSVISGPAGASPILQATDGVATFATDTAGDYEVRVETTDVNAGATSLTFPIHVSALSCPAQDQCHAAGSCDLSTGACSNPSAPNGTTCDDGDASTSSDVCSSGVCAGTVSSCACPAGFTSLPGNQCAKSYDIDASLLVNQNGGCDATGVNRFNECNGVPYGFQWTDVGGSLGAVTHVDIELETGIACTAGSRLATLNGAPMGSFNTVGDCACNSLHGLVSLTSLNPSSYVRGGANSVAIAPTSCEGLSQSAALNSAFARVNVVYGLGQACGGPICGDSVCDATESCSSCAADCGTCAPACPGTDLGSTVPQTVTGSTVGLTNTLTPTCVSVSTAPEATFGFTAPASGIYSIDTVGSVYDTVLYLTDGTCGGASLACNDDASGVQSSVTVPLTAGQTVAIVVDGYLHHSGSFTLNIAKIN